MQESRKVFDDIVSSPPTVTSLDHDEFLSNVGQLVIMAKVTDLQFRGISGFTCTVQHSSDGRRWRPKNASPEIPSGTVGWNGVGAFAGGEPYPTRPSLRFVRLAVDFAGGPARVVLYVSRRRVSAPVAADDRVAQTQGASKVRSLLSAATQAELAGLRASPGLSQQTLGAVRRAMAATATSAPDSRRDAVLQLLSGSALDEVRALSRRLSRLSPNAQGDLLLAGTAAAIASIVEGSCACKEG